MLKKLNVALALTLVLGLAACGGSKPEEKDPAEQTGSKDGFYYAEEQPDEKGWKYVVGVEVKEGKISSVDFDSINVVNGGKTKKTLSADGEYNMVAFGKAIAEWHEQAASLEKFIVDNNGVDKVAVKDDSKTDSVTGVTIKVGNLVELVKKALDSTPVEKGALKDGFYKAEAAEFGNGWKGFVTVAVKFGNIVTVNWDAVSETEGSDNKSVASVNGAYDMKNDGLKWHEQAKALTDKVVADQGIANIKLTDADGHTDAVTGVTIKVGEFVELFNKAMESAK